MTDKFLSSWAGIIATISFGLFMLSHGWESAFEDRGLFSRITSWASIVAGIGFIVSAILSLAALLRSDRQK